ncbi:MAG: hypothetical protein ACQESP_10580 [Candidatus Muiribacteriota bacterium]
MLKYSHMQKIKNFFLKVLFYKIIEAFILSGLVFFIFFNLKTFTPFNINPILFSVLFLAFYVFKNREFFIYKRFLTKVENLLPEYISVINLESFDNLDKKYGFSKKLIEKEKERNLEFIKKHKFKVNFLSLFKPFLLMVAFGILIPFFPTNEKLDDFEFVYDVKPGDMEIFYNENVEFKLKHNHYKEFQLVIETQQGEKVYDLDSSLSFEKEINQKVYYYFQSIDKSFRTDIYEINVVYPLNLEKIDVTVYFPSYLDVSPQVSDNESFEALEKSRINMQFYFNNDIENLSFIPSKEVDFKYGDSKNEVIINLDTSFEYKIKAEGKYSSFESPLYQVECTEDSPPVIEIISPETKNIVSETGDVYIKFMARDDFGLQESNLLLEYEDGSTKEIFISEYESSEIIQEFQFKLEKSAFFEIQVTDILNYTLSEKIFVEIIDDFSALKEVMKGIESETEGFENIVEKTADEMSEAKENLTDMYKKGNISDMDKRYLSDLSESIEEIYSEGEQILENIDDLEEFAKNHDISSEIVKKMTEIREEISKMLEENLLEFMSDISEVSQKNSMDFSDYQKFNDRTNLENLNKQLEQTMELINKAKKESEERAVIEYIEEIIKSQKTHMHYCIKNHKQNDYGTLSGIKIRGKSILSSFRDIIDYIEYEPEKVEEILNLFELSIELVFDNIDKSIEKQEILISRLNKMLDNLKRNFESNLQKERDEIALLLEDIYDITKNILMKINHIASMNRTGKRASDMSGVINDTDKLIFKAREIFKEISSKSFILETGYFANYNETSVFLNEIYERGKENRPVNSYINMSESHMMETGVHIVEAISKMDGMDSPTAISELMDRIREISQRQQQMSEEMLQMMQQGNFGESFMDYYSTMQQMLRKEAENILHEQISGQLNEAASEMAEIEKKLVDEDIDEEFLKNKQESLKEKFQRMLITLSDKSDEDEYERELPEKEDFEFDFEETVEGEVRKIKEINLPDGFPEVDADLNQMIRDYLNGL